MVETQRLTTRRRLTTAVLGFTTAGVMAGGAAGYLIHGTAGAARAVPAIVAPAPAGHALNADSAAGYRIDASGATRHAALNGDSSSGYGTGRAAGTPARALNADSASGY